MGKLKQWIALTALACVAVAAAGWFLVISPKRSEAASLQQQTAQQLTKNQQESTHLQVLKAQAKDLPKEQAKLAAVATKIPDNPALPGLVRALLDAANGAGVELVSITPGPPAAVGATTAAAPVAPSTAAPAAPTGTRPAATGPAAGTLSQIPIALNVVGDYFEVQQFLAAVEDLPRALRVQNLQVAPGTSPTDKSTKSTDDGRTLSATITGDVYMAGNRPAAAAPTAPAAPGTTAAVAGGAVAPAAAAAATAPSASPAK